ncbi:MAG: type II secretion system protein GspN, partial [Desulfatibacillaceae bacterium]|nr:type II secretion system protein GspN [Desulfatibacillaceae bacterium]
SCLNPGKVTRRIMAKKILFYGAFLIFCLVAFAYLLFPGEKAADYLEAFFASRGPDYRLFVERVTPNPPFGFSLKNTEIISGGQILFAAKSVAVRPGLFSMLANRPKGRITSQAYGGHITAKIETLGSIQEGSFKTLVVADGLDLEKITFLERLTDRAATGRLDARIDFAGEPRQWTNGQGEGEITLVNGRIQFFAEVLGLDALTVDQLLAKFSLESGVLEISRGEMTSREASGVLTGKIHLAPVFAQSRLNLSGSIRPTPALFSRIGPNSPVAAFLRSRMQNGEIRVNITGTVDNSRIVLG